MNTNRNLAILLTLLITSMLVYGMSKVVYASIVRAAAREARGDGEHFDGQEKRKKKKHKKDLPWL